MPTSALRIPAEGAAPPRVGRPPRVQAPDIIAAAIEIGLDKVTLKQVADRLGVGIATLYRHVRNRDELVRLAAFRVALTSRLRVVTPSRRGTGPRSRSATPRPCSSPSRANRSSSTS